MEEIRDYIRHLAFCGDAETGVLVRKNSREEIRIQLPVGGSVMLTRDGVYTVIRRTETGQFYVYTDKLFS